MLGTNFLGGHVFVHIGDAVASGTDATAATLSALDLAAHGARRVVAVSHTGTAGGTAVVDMKLQASDASGGPWVDVPGAALSGVALAANKFVAIEVDTNSVELKRYVRIARQRKTAGSSVLSTFFILSDLRQPGRSLTRGDMAGAAVGQGKAA